MDNSAFLPDKVRLFSSHVATSDKCSSCVSSDNVDVDIAPRMDIEDKKWKEVHWQCVPSDE